VVTLWYETETKIAYNNLHRCSAMCKQSYGCDNGAFSVIAESYSRPIPCDTISRLSQHWRNGEVVSVRKTWINGTVVHTMHFLLLMNLLNT
jgi:hypothetical protein